MTLADYLAANRVSVAALAERAKTTPQTIYGLLRGTHSPRLNLVLRIVRATGGQVRPEDLDQATANESQ